MSGRVQAYHIGPVGVVSPVSHETKVSRRRPTGMQIHRLQLQVDDVGEVVEGLNDPNAGITTQEVSKSFPILYLSITAMAWRPLYNSRAHGLREVHNTGERICDGGVNGDIHSQAG